MSVKTVKQKKKSTTMKVVKWVLFLLVVGITVTGFVLSEFFYGEKSWFNQTVSDNGFVQWMFQHIPSVVASVQIITICWFVSIVLHFILSKAFTRTKRGVTVVKLINSFISWIVVIVAFLLVLSAWGVDTGALLASAGILSLIIGLGAQSLIADIIAGLFIVIEGEYQVGDIVIIDDWRGTVLEIGIRTTRLLDVGGNVKIINNSDIRAIVNQTRDLSVAKAIISIEYGDSIPRVEKIINENLAKIKEHIPAIVDGPTYNGVDSLGASSVNLLFLAKCKEEDIYQVQRDLNRELKIMFDENGINIPFPQIVLNQPSEKSPAQLPEPEEKPSAPAATEPPAEEEEETGFSALRKRIKKDIEELKERKEAKAKEKATKEKKND